MGNAYTKNKAEKSVKALYNNATAEIPVEMVTVPLKILGKVANPFPSDILTDLVKFLDQPPINTFVDAIEKANCKQTLLRELGKISTYTQMMAEYDFLSNRYEYSKLQKKFKREMVNVKHCINIIYQQANSLTTISHVKTWIHCACIALIIEMIVSCDYDSINRKLISKEKINNYNNNNINNNFLISNNSNDFDLKYDSKWSRTFIQDGRKLKNKLLKQCSVVKLTDVHRMHSGNMRISYYYVRDDAHNIREPLPFSSRRFSVRKHCEMQHTAAQKYLKKNSKIDKALSVWELLNNPNNNNNNHNNAGAGCYIGYWEGNGDYHSFNNNNHDNNNNNNAYNNNHNNREDESPEISNDYYSYNNGYSNNDALYDDYSHSFNKCDDNNEYESFSNNCDWWPLWAALFVCFVFWFWFF